MLLAHVTKPKADLPVITAGGPLESALSAGKNSTSVVTSEHGGKIPRRKGDNHTRRQQRKLGGEGFGMLGFDSPPYSDHAGMVSGPVHLLRT